MSRTNSPKNYRAVADGRMVDVFGTAPTEADACFIADEIIVESTEAP